MEEAFNNIYQLLYIVAGIMAIIGVCRIFYLWNSGKRDIEGDIVKWVGGIFLFLLAATVSVALFK